MLKSVKPDRFLSSCFVCVLFAACLLFSGKVLAGSSFPSVVGTLASKPQRAQKLADAGIYLATVGVLWEKFEPSRGQYDLGYAREIKKVLEVYRKKGIRVSLDLGLQYPPQWARKLPGWLYVNQYGDKFISSKPGDNGLNAVFNSEVRNAQEKYVAKVFELLGNDFYGVRLGWGYYGELNYPEPEHAGRKNCYWAYDDIAQGKTSGLPRGVKPCPVPGWLPGQGSAGHDSARKFAGWYLDSMHNYHDWQIATVRKHYKGLLFMMMGSWMLRKGQLDDLVARDLGMTPNTEIQRGFDFGRYIAAVKDPGYVVYCTWADAPEKHCNDTGSDERRWSPLKQFAAFARRNPLRLKVWCENTGRGSRKEMELTFRRCRENNVEGLVWAFEDDLFSNRKNLATLGDLQDLLKKYHVTGTPLK